MSSLVCLYYIIYRHVCQVKFTIIINYLENKHNTFVIEIESQQKFGAVRNNLGVFFCLQHPTLIFAGKDGGVQIKERGPESNDHFY